MEILQNCVMPHKISKVKTQDPWKFQELFLNTLGISTSFLIDPWNFHMLFLPYSWKLHLLKPSPHPIWIFSGIAQ